MPKKQKYKAQVATFKITSTLGKDLFLEIAMRRLGDMYVHMESKTNNISFHLEGDRSKLKPIITDLNNISYHIEDATVSKGGTYEFHNNLIKLLLRPNLKLDYLAVTLQLFDHYVELYEDSIVTDVEYYLFKKIHGLASEAQQKMTSDQDRDIQKLFALAHLYSGIEDYQIAEIAIKEGILRQIDDKYQFAVDKTKAFQSLKSKITDPRILPSITVDEDVIVDPSEFFDGGKIVFMQNGEELDSSPFDKAENTKDREE